MLQKILFALILFTQIGCAQPKGENKMDKPFYTVKIDAVNTEIVVTLNGEEVFSDFDRSQKHLEMPVNHWITSGENKLEVKLLTYDDHKFKMNSNAEVTITLQVKESGKFNITPMAISKITYHKGTESSTPQEGTYNSKEAMKSDLRGDVKISKLIKKTIDGAWTGEKVKGIMLTQYITLKTPFPRWKFLDSEQIFDGNYMLDVVEDEAYEKLKKRKDIQEAYSLVDRIQKSLKRKDVSYILSLLKERNSELEIALYKPKGYYENELRKSLTELVNNPDYEIFIPTNPPFYISEGGKTLSIKNSISFNKIKVSGNSYYPILFRRENGKWILTR